MVGGASRLLRAPPCPCAALRPQAQAPFHYFEVHPVCTSAPVPLRPWSPPVPPTLQRGRRWRDAAFISALMGYGSTLMGYGLVMMGYGVPR